MIKKILDKAIYFFKLDLRWKLIKLNLYPSSFIKTGINKIYSKLILNILFYNNFSIPPTISVIYVKSLE